MAVPPLAAGQTGVGSLNDPCDCMQNHDFWMASRAVIQEVFWTDDFDVNMFDPNHVLHRWLLTQSCMYSPENEESHRPTALSDCIPGFLMVHLICVQRHLLGGRPERAMDYAREMVRLLPWGANCHEASDWPLKPDHVWRYYHRMHRAWAGWPASEGPWPQRLLRAMAWAPPHGEEHVGEAADVCYFDSLPDAGVCWLLGGPGQSCREACAERRMTFMHPLGQPESPVVPRILALANGIPERFVVQPEWAPFECYVSSQGRFHLAAPEDPPPPDWSYPICELACPCTPPEPAEILEVLAEVPALGEIVPVSG